MNDKFVVNTNEIGEIIVTDVETDRVYRYDSAVDFFGLIRLLNEQQSTITKLKELNGDKGKRIISLIRTNKTLKEENRELRQSVEYWQKKYEKGTETFQID